MTALRASPFVLRGWHVLASLLAFFGIVIGINIYFAFAAINTFPGEDVTHPYIQGLEYNRTLAARKVQEAQGWQVTARLAPDGAAAALVVEARQRDGAPLTGARIDGVLRWPTDSHRDRRLAFREIGGGVYVAPLSGLSEGDWDLRATATSANNNLDFEADLRWPLPR